MYTRKAEWIGRKEGRKDGEKRAEKRGEFSDNWHYQKGAKTKIYRYCGGGLRISTHPEKWELQEFGEEQKRSAQLIAIKKIRIEKFLSF